jgi:hypothetical protein
LASALLKAPATHNIPQILELRIDSLFWRLTHCDPELAQEPAVLAGVDRCTCLKENAYLPAQLT